MGEKGKLTTWPCTIFLLDNTCVNTVASDDKIFGDRARERESARVCVCVRERQ